MSNNALLLAAYPIAPHVKDARQLEEAVGRVRLLVVHKAVALLIGVAPRHARLGQLLLVHRHDAVGYLGIGSRKVVLQVVLAVVGHAKVVDHVGVGAILQVLPVVVAHQAAAAVDAELVHRAATLEIGHVVVKAVGKVGAGGLLKLVERRLVLLKPLALGARLRLRAVRAPKSMKKSVSSSASSLSAWRWTPNSKGMRTEPSPPSLHTCLGHSCRFSS